MEFYFSKYESRKPPLPSEYNRTRELVWQFLVSICLILGAWYIWWRWNYSLNLEALWFSIPLVIAESAAYVGLILYAFNLWKIEDIPAKSPPYKITECVGPNNNYEDRPISVDVFFPTYDEEPELVRLSIIDAKKIEYPHSIKILIHILDDGKRDSMKRVAVEEGVNYITRDNNIGFKAGNMRNAMEQTAGDFIVICDADTRPFPSILKNTLGYFKDPQVAWVQTPQWFFDIHEGLNLRFKLKKMFGIVGYHIGNGIEKLFGEIKIGKDPLSNDPIQFYDIIQRRRNWANAAFCCGAGSIHRREAVMEAALKNFSTQINNIAKIVTSDIDDLSLKRDLTEEIKKQMIYETEFTPYKFHVSEDFYTSIVLHGDDAREWKSVYHPYVESKMLSPQDLLSWTIQRFKYAGGTLDICIHDNPLVNSKMTVKQKLMYSATFYSYFGALWNVVFILAPIIYFFTEIPPVSAYSAEFFYHFIPFYLMSEIAFRVGTYGIPTWSGRAGYLSFFPVNLRAIWTVLKGEKIKFPTTPKDIQGGTHFRIVIPQFLVMVLTIAGILFSIGRILLGYADNIGGFMANVYWALLNALAMWKMIRAAFFNYERAETELESIKKSELRPNVSPT